jgi:hypothetical protein
VPAVVIADPDDDQVIAAAIAARLGMREVYAKNRTSKT